MIEELRREIEWRWARSLPLRRAIALVGWRWLGAQAATTARRDEQR